MSFIKVGVNTLDIRQIPVPRGSIQVTLTQDMGEFDTKKQMFFTEDEFLKFFKPLVDYYEGVKREQSRD